MKRSLAFLLVVGCHQGGAPQVGTKLEVHNTQAIKATVYVSFGSDSVVTADDWGFCEGSKLSCSFEMAGGELKPLTTGGEYVNATFSFNAPVGCGSTKAEANINNPDWYDVLDVSLVDGYSNDVEIINKPTGGDAVHIGLPNGQSGNETVFGLFPYGCDTCVARENPPCGISKGTNGCKAGTQNDPNPPCQFQGAKKGGGEATVEIVLK